MADERHWHKEAEFQWDNRADFWNQRSVEMWDNGSRKNITPFIEEHLQPESSIIDVGCGDGYGSFKLYQSGYHVTGVDISGEMIRLAKKRLHQEDIFFSQGDVIDLPIQDNGIDSVMAINVIEWTESPVDVLKEFDRVLTTNGILFAGILGPTAGPRMNSYSRLRGERTICNTMMPWEFQQLALEIGFDYADGFGVFKNGVSEHHYRDLPLDLQQALSFMWVFMLRKVGK
ncbi:bifunctional 2-polyprenyl-6-hydroxyphenol methylase/3-demethylubiquinol 3-O-methyltransferase UbiG [Lentibacillus sp. CBA3610]|uniref:class I SAM-dependent methyltransferase n=1 Tax=Lentibacillus sp. CBA3610 TaxID=2518176 RepID=UPI001595B0DE|nr:class I SAM-dependent methyltransferase [Lentibacillus sp. CBA3610]QKY71169.1 class I SAM-dependent methyltransferase [Lentibacillus sp. CBA3610]